MAQQSKTDPNRVFSFKLAGVNNPRRKEARERLLAWLNEYETDPTFTGSALTEIMTTLILEYGEHAPKSDDQNRALRLLNAKVDYLTDLLREIGKKAPSAFVQAHASVQAPEGDPLTDDFLDAMAADFYNSESR